MIKIVCSCGNEATRIKKENENAEPKFNLYDIKRSGRIVGIEFECIGCGEKLSLVSK